MSNTNEYQYYVRIRVTKPNQEILVDVQLPLGGDYHEAREIVNGIKVESVVGVY